MHDIRTGFRRLRDERDIVRQRLQPVAILARRGDREDNASGFDAELLRQRRSGIAGAHGRLPSQSGLRSDIWRPDERAPSGVVQASRITPSTTKPRLE